MRNEALHLRRIGRQLMVAKLGEVLVERKVLLEHARAERYRRDRCLDAYRMIGVANGRSNLVGQ